MLRIASGLCVFGLVVGLGLAMFGARPAAAGQSFGMGFSCGPSGSNYRCSGSLRGARVSAGASDYAKLRLSSSGTVSFFANFSGASYACSFASTPSSKIAPVIAGDYNMYFNLTMDTSGNCSSAYFENDSSYQSLAKP
jgi:hypothetical protein